MKSKYKLERFKISRSKRYVKMEFYSKHFLRPSILFLAFVRIVVTKIFDNFWLNERAAERNAVGVYSVTLDGSNLFSSEIAKCRPTAVFERVYRALP